MIHGVIDHDPPEPVVKRRFAPVTLNGIERVNKGILHNVLGVRAYTDHPEAGVIHRLVILPVYLHLGLAAARFTFLYQLIHLIH